MNATLSLKVSLATPFPASALVVEVLEEHPVAVEHLQCCGRWAHRPSPARAEGAHPAHEVLVLVVPEGLGVAQLVALVLQELLHHVELGLHRPSRSPSRCSLLVQGTVQVAELPAQGGEAVR
eukprot:3002283-Alexandrium_andersonii.AAC.1